MHKLVVAIAFATLVTSAIAADNPYAGLEQRGIKSLSQEQIRGYLDGHGMQLALPAELNSYPGPVHALDLGATLKLSDAQRERTQRLIQQMFAESKPLGKQLVDRETELDRLFASASIDESTLRRVTGEIAEIQGRLRFTHLKYHLAMRQLLSPEQIARYNESRGYTGNKPPAMHGDAHHGQHR